MAHSGLRLLLAVLVRHCSIAWYRGVMPYIATAVYIPHASADMDADMDSSPNYFPHDLCPRSNMEHLLVHCNLNLMPVCAILHVDSTVTCKRRPDVIGRLASEEIVISVPVDCLWQL